MPKNKDGKKRLKMLVGVAEDMSEVLGLEPPIGGKKDEDKGVKDMSEEELEIAIVRESKELKDSELKTEVVESDDASENLEQDSWDLIKALREDEEPPVVVEPKEEEEPVSPKNKDTKKDKKAAKAAKPAADKKAAKPAKKDTKPAKKDTKPAKKKGPGVIASIVEFLEASKKGITKEEILAKLVKRFPERDGEAMGKTINVQVPGRITKERDLDVVTKDGKFKIK